jgi:hypothetical protein
MARAELPVPEGEPYRSRMARARKVARYFFAAGGVLVITSAFHWWQRERTFARMRVTTCTVLSRKIETDTLVSAPAGRRSSGPRNVSYRENAHLTLGHRVDGRQYVFSEAFIYDWALYAHLGFNEGKDYPCRFDPDNPANGTVRDEPDSNDSGNIFAFGMLALLLGWFIPEGVKLAAQNAEMRRRA